MSIPYRDIPYPVQLTIPDRDGLIAAEINRWLEHIDVTVPRGYENVGLYAVSVVPNDPEEIPMVVTEGNPNLDSDRGHFGYAPGEELLLAEDIIVRTPRRPAPETSHSHWSIS